MRKRLTTNIAVFASGRGSNFSALVRSSSKGVFKGRISLLVCDNPKAGVLHRARKAGVASVVIERARFKSREGFESEIIKCLRRHKIHLVALAGFMRMLSPGFVRRYRNRIINIHPALLPSFKGAHGIKDAFDYGVKQTGVTVHFVDARMDHGPIILQRPLEVKNRETMTSLEARIHRLEHELYPKALKLIIEKRVKVRGRKVIIRPPA